ncbi:DegT/DnrJ/EryC1/StrS family aminotransferase [Streptomyces europaeiscabiei]|uniref:DegT/DnrJ/EryC1/StrS family aminotransferase n=1 Tax=Streptomyces europaeiscabiei TaxID=146819 RepID=UPI0029A927A6|nr:DegT/DnrJ/EryC1/StrS aminotransferase family protein [Streptomyces europaeiscabiei]MDX2525298.1 DegT/DnrJ/EryC1/StrS aminotransferase family protein [Streptomyces europaeiscabiei]
MTLAEQQPARSVSLADNTIGAEEIAAVTDVLTSRWLTAGPVSRAFEAEFAAALGVSDAVAVSSGTAALHLAVLALALRPGDEVIMPSLTFVASAAVVALQRGVPVFADIVSATEPTVSPEEVRALITPRTRAVVAMHYGGYPARTEELRTIAAANGLALIEDAAHSPVVRGAGPALGTVGDIGCFSFHATKNMTTGEGGMVVARDQTVLDRIRSMRSLGITRTSWDRTVSGGSDYDIVDLGLNYRPTEVGSAIGRVQLGRLAADREQRRELTRVYHELLAREVPDVLVPWAGRTEDSAYHLMATVLPERASRAGVRAALRADGVQTSVHYRPVHSFTRFRDAGRHGDGPRRPLPVTEQVADRLLTLPLHSRMTTNDVAFVVDRLSAALGGPDDGVRP